MQYQQDKYREHLSVLQEMRKSVADRLRQTGFNVILSDGQGLSATSTAGQAGKDAGVPDLEERYPESHVIYVDLAEGIVRVERDWDLKRAHAILEKLNVPHAYFACGDSPEPDGAFPPSTICLSIKDAMEHLPQVFEQARAEIRDGWGRAGKGQSR
jgi:hypothetical protein